MDTCFKITQDLWKTTFNEDFFFAGGMFRGNPPNELTYSKTDIIFLQVCYLFPRFELNEVSLENKSGTKSDNSFLLQIEWDFVKYEPSNKSFTKIKDKKLIKSEEKINNLDIAYNDSNNQISKVSLKYTAQFNDKFSKKMLNVFTKCSRFHPAYTFVVENQLDLVTQLKTDQEHTMNLNDPYNNEYYLKFKWSIKNFSNRNVKLKIIKSPFQQVKMNDVKQNFKNFDLDIVQYSDDEKGVHAKHFIDANLGLKSIPIYTLEMLHCFSRKWSSIRIVRNKLILASSQVINSENLPNTTQINSQYNQNKLSESSSGIVLDNRYERAMLVKNLIDKDFAIIKGKWIEMRKGIPGIPGKVATRERGVPGRAGNPGHLLISYQLIKSNTIQFINIGSDFSFVMKTQNIKINLTCGEQCGSNANMHSMQ